jgi:threonine/homoserine/homoserine lactone efflux protein
VTGVHDLALFVAAGWLLNLTPGPDMAYIAARSASGGFNDGVAAVLGITAGCCVHTLAAALGLSAMLATSATAFELVKWCGAGYLLYAGMRLLFAAHGREAQPGNPSPAAGAPMPDRFPAQAANRSHARAPKDVSGTSPLRIFREALMINVLNPKVALFYLAFLPQFIATDASAKFAAFLLLGALFNVNSLFVNVPVAWLASRAGRRLRGTPRAMAWLSRAMGGLFIALAARLSLLSRD